MTDFNLKHIQEAANYGKLSNHPDYKHGAILIIKNTPYYAYNRFRTHPKSPKPYKTMCAEFGAVIASRADLKAFRKAKLYVARLKKNGTLGMSKPCIWCQEMITKLGIKRVFYSTDKGYESLY